MDRNPDQPTTGDDSRSGGLGPDGTIPDDPDGVAAGFTGEPSTFEPEEDEQAPASDDARGTDQA